MTDDPSRNETASGADDPSTSGPDPLFAPDDDEMTTLFRNRTLLEVGTVPDSDRIVGRDTEIQNLAGYIRPVVSGAAPTPVLVYGKTGPESRWCLDTSPSAHRRRRTDAVDDSPSRMSTVHSIRRRHRLPAPWPGR
jgi:Cdc6-related protein, AAA superfamily ATPase